MILNADAAATFGSAADPSFVPYISAESLQLFNVSDATKSSPATDFIKKSYQSIRNRLYGRHVDKKEHISIPEILSYYGMKFELDLAADIQNIYERPGKRLRKCLLKRWNEDGSVKE